MKARYFLGLVVVIISVLSVGYVETHYTMEGVVKDGCIVDSKGEEWVFDNAYKDGTKVSILFDTNCTDNTRYDDIIVNIKAK